MNYTTTLVGNNQKLMWDHIIYLYGISNDNIQQRIVLILLFQW